MNLVETDSSGKRFVDVPTLSGEHARITFVPGEQAGYGVDCIRFQIRDATGHLRQGPELPVSTLSEVSVAVISLLEERIGG